MNLDLSMTKMAWSTNVIAHHDCFLEFGGHKIPHSLDLELLGTIFTISKELSSEIDNRISKAWKTFWNWFQWLGNRHTDMKYRIKLLNISALQSLIYAIEFQDILPAEVRRLAHCYHLMIWRMDITKDKQKKWYEQSRFGDEARHAKALLKLHKYPAFAKLLAVRKWKAVEKV